ncbi:hypothetical protein [Flavobacterium microcysteis]|uniref:Uncharacterized protein n=1 Tax=Flavobacterium microcysteis TaxID=2596891 RepID=A0A501QEG6_9FLAO|nr:hypothetical protein [Flavobacterium microcysteis]TPD71279.1 hypothetical protein FJA49_05100 [Flavobacterium microcysteis]
MANIYLENWIKKSELDFYTMFIKTWLPFNAWYMNQFYDETANRTSDRSIIDHIKNNSNRYRDKIISLLRNNDNDSIAFKRYISDLYYELEAHPMPNEDERISFHTINITRNAIPQHVVSFGQFDYKVVFDNTLPKTTKRWKCEIYNRRTTRTLHLVELYQWSLQELSAEPNYIAIPNEKKQYLDACFREMNPRKPEIIIAQPKQNTDGSHGCPANAIIIDSVKHLYITNNYEQVAKVIIELLYELRCKLFHAEIDPINAYLGIYENAFFIQKKLIKELI